MKRYIIILLLLCFFHIFNNFIILKIDTTPLTYDGKDYFILSLDFYKWFFPKEERENFIKISPYRPPFFLLSTIPFYILFGKNPDIAVMTNALYIIIFTFSIFGIGKVFFNEAVGIISAFIASFFPIVFGFSRMYYLDFALMAMVTLSIYLLLKTENFRNRLYSFLFGLSFGIGLLTKWSYMLWILGPLSYISYHSIHSYGRRASINLFTSLIIGFLIASIWYIPNAKTIFPKLYKISFHPVYPFNIKEKPFLLSGILYYLKALIIDEISPPFFAIFIFSIPLLFSSKVMVKEKSIFLFTWFFFPFLLFSSSPTRCERFTLPYLPVFALITASGFNCMKDKLMRRVALSSIILLGIFQFSFISYRPNRTFWVGMRHHKGMLYPLKFDWKTNEILQFLEEDKGKKDFIEVLFIPNIGPIHSPLVYTSRLKQNPFLLTNTPAQWDDFPFGRFDYEKAIEDADYVVDKSGYKGCPHIIIEKLTLAFEKKKDEFLLVKTFKMPDNSTLFIYKKKVTKRGGT